MLCSNKRAPFPARLGMPPKALAIRLKRVVAPAFSAYRCQPDVCADPGQKRARERCAGGSGREN